MEGFSAEEVREIMAVQSLIPWELSNEEMYEALETYGGVEEY